MEIHERVEGQDPVTGTNYVRDTHNYVPSAAERSAGKVNKAGQVIWLVEGIISVLLLLRIAFLLFGARSVGFADMLYAVTDPFVRPFSGIFAAPSVSGSYFDSAAVLAVVIYSLLAWGLVAIIEAASRNTTPVEL